MEPALALAREIVEVADRQDDTIYQLVGYRLLGMIQVWMGRNREALESLQQVRAIPRSGPTKTAQLSVRNRSRPRRPLLQDDGRCSSSASTIRRRESTEQVLAELPSHGHAFTVALCNGMLAAWPELLFGDLEACERHSVELVAYCAEKKVEIWRSIGVVYHACARATREPTAENIAALRTAIDAQHPSGAYVTDSGLISHLAEALLMAGDVTGAEAALQEAFAFVEQSGERFWLAELHRLDGQIALKQREPDRTRAEACFLQAVEIARGQEARMLELRASTDLARLWRDIGSPNDPRALLEPILAAIEGGESTRDVRDARALLAEIA